MMQVCQHPIADLLPHAGRMILLDRVTGYDETTVEAELAVRPNNPFFEAGKGIAAHIAIEWMAQACAAFVGLEALRKNQPVRVGFLLGTRNFRAERAWFRAGEILTVRSELVFQDGETGVFDCTLRDAAVAARAQLTLHQPADLAAVLKSQGIDVTNLGSR
jgi:predicted hotdog family 3-hydroxylacyl-ACP dehydratase